MKSQGSTTITVVGVIVALVVGGFVGGAIANNMKNKSNSTSMSASPQAAVTSKAADLRASLVSLGTSHMDLTYTAVSSALQGSKSATVDQEALFNNGSTLAAAVGSVYGADAEKAFNDLWKVHLNDFVKYAVASSKGDMAGKQAALADIDSGYTKPLAAYLAKANPNLPEAALYTGLKTHVDMTAKMIEAQAAGDYTAAQDQLKMAIKHIEGLMTTLADGIVKQFPQKF